MWLFWTILVAVIGYQLFRLRALVRHGVEVELKVYRNIIEWGDAFQMMPEFMIISGVYKGKRAVTKIGSNLITHKTGSKVVGLYSPQTGEIESLSAIKRAKIFCYSVISGGTLLLLWEIIKILKL